MADDDEVTISGGIRDKLVEKKQEWARDGRLLTGETADPEKDRLPPGQRLVKDWPVLDLGAEPDVTPEKFRLDVDGVVENKLSLRLDAFMALPQSESVSDMHCVTQWSRYDNNWKGVSAKALLEKRGFGDVWYGPMFVSCARCGGSNRLGANWGVGAHYTIGKDSEVIDLVLDRIRKLPVAV